MSLVADMARYFVLSPTKAAWYAKAHELADVSMTLDYGDVPESERAQLVAKKRELIAECERLQAVEMGEVVQ
jgi:hypothetical protein